MKGGHDLHVFLASVGVQYRATQLFAHTNVRLRLSGVLQALLDALAAAKLAERVVVLLVSEFGRTVRYHAWPASTAALPVVSFPSSRTSRVVLLGGMRSLVNADPTNGDLKTTMDFRRIYATVLEVWLSLPGKAALVGCCEPAPASLISQSLPALTQGDRDPSHHQGRARVQRRPNAYMAIVPSPLHRPRHRPTGASPRKKRGTLATSERP